MASHHTRDLGAISTLIRRDLDSNPVRDRAEMAYVPRGHLRPYLTTQACSSVTVDICSARKCPDPPVGAQTAPGRGWDLTARRRPEEAQSRACSPPQGRPRRPPPISRGPSRPLPTNHTLARVGRPTGPRRWPSLHTAETTAMTTRVVSFRPLILQHTLSPDGVLARQRSSGAEACGWSGAERVRGHRAQLASPSCLKRTQEAAVSL